MGRAGVGEGQLGGAVQIWTRADIEAFKSDYDWQEGFKVAGSDVTEVTLVIAASPGENDGANWIAAVLLADGRFAAIHAWCDYTGWG